MERNFDDHVEDSRGKAENVHLMLRIWFGRIFSVKKNSSKKLPDTYNAFLTTGRKNLLETFQANNSTSRNDFKNFFLKTLFFVKRFSGHVKHTFE